MSVKDRAPFALFADRREGFSGPDGEPRESPAHEVMRANDFSNLTALSRNCLRFPSSFATGPHFVMRKETFRFAPLKPLKSLGALNQPFRGFLCYQGLEAGFISLCSRATFSGPFRPA
jgi:hypothetical protein